MENKRWFADKNHPIDQKFCQQNHEGAQCLPDDERSSRCNQGQGYLQLQLRPLRKKGSPEQCLAAKYE